VAVVCALAALASADPMPSREYPPTYSSKKAPWYDPFALFTSADKAPAPVYQSTPIQNETIEAGSGTPAWKWYGYGTPTPGRNPLAPNGAYAAVPTNWHLNSGTTPGAIPTGKAVPVIVPDPDPLPKPIPGPASSIATVPPGGPTGFATADLVPDWKPATIRMPSANPEAPPATLKAPVPVDAIPTSGPAREAATPLGRELPPSESPDIPVEPAPGIVAPPPGGISMADRPLTARGLAPAGDVATSIRQACGMDVRVMEVSPMGPNRLLVRLAGTLEAARSARERMAQLPELREYRVDFDLVTPLR
jgi:hypothetical protein